MKSDIKHSELIISSITDLIDIIERLNRSSLEFVFRGQANSEWKFSPSVERNFNIYDFENSNNRIKRYEKKLYKGFVSSAHHFVKTEDMNFDDYVDAFSLMQHYGYKTRLLDFTKSLFIALYFVIENKYEFFKNGSVYMINKTNLITKLSKKDHKLNVFLEKKDEFIAKDNNYSDEIFFNRMHDIADKCLDIERNDEFPTSILIVEPKKKNKRIMMQQGLFIMQTDFNKKFIENLASAFNGEYQDIKHIFENDISKKAKIYYNLICDDLNYIFWDDIIKLVIPYGLKTELELFMNHINVNAITLFPDEEGLKKYIDENTSKIL